jgi:uncharacterized protein
MPETNKLFTTGIIAFAVIASAWLLGSSVERTRNGGNEIRVTGSARKEIESDFIAWTGRIAYRSASMNEGYKAAKDSVNKLVEYLKKNGLTDKEIVIGAVQTNALYEQKNGQNDNTGAFRTVAGYDVSQSVTVRSSNVELVEKVSRESTDLIAQGVALESSSPQFFYTKIGDVKREILGLAAEDALARAKEVASKSGSTVGGVKSARMAPLQITPRYDFDIYDAGYNDLTSKEKAITAVVTMTFSIK